MNYNAEVILVIYPHGTGGRFLELLLNDKDINASELVEQLNKYKRLFLRDPPPGEGLNFDNYDYQDRYVFAVHDDIGIHPNFYLCSKLKIVAVVATSEVSQELLKRRRIYLGEDPFLCKHESSLLSTFQHNIRVDAYIELEDFWTPIIAIPMLESLLLTFNVKHSNLKELYNTWHEKAIAPI